MTCEYFPAGALTSAGSWGLVVKKQAGVGISRSTGTDFDWFRHADLAPLSSLCCTHHHDITSTRVFLVELCVRSELQHQPQHFFFFFSFVFGSVAVQWLALSPHNHWGNNSELELDLSQYSSEDYYLNLFDSISSQKAGFHPINKYIKKINRVLLVKFMSIKRTRVPVFIFLCWKKCSFSQKLS